MRSALYAVTLLAIPSLALAAKKEEPPYPYGPTPAWQSFRSLSEAAILARLVDPNSAKINWLSGPHKSVYKPLLERRVHGYVACGTVNARNRMGGYTGAQTFVVVIDFDRVLYVDIDNRPTGLVTENCMAALSSGALPPVPDEAAPQPISGQLAADAADPTTAIGLSLRAMPEGAYVSAVAPGSAADRTGLKPGMVITTVNAIPLKDMGEAMLKIVEAARPNASLSIIGGHTMRLGDQ